MQLFFFTYHKSGTVLCRNIGNIISTHLNQQHECLNGQVKSINRSTPIINFSHSLISFELGNYPHKGIRIIRDPRDIWVSGYLYHRKTTEMWCTNQPISSNELITFPQVPFSREHLPESEKKAYIDDLGGASYQKNLLMLYCYYFL